MSNLLLDSYQDLYQIPIDALDLSEKALRVLKWCGVTSILHCIMFYLQDAHQRATDSARLTPFMYGEVEAAMKKHNYWPYVMDAAIWRDIHRYRFRRGGKIVTWQGYDLNLHDAPVERLDLPAETTKRLRKQNLRQLAACIEYFIHDLNRFRHRQIFDGPGLGPIRTKPDLTHLYQELEQALRDKGYWRFVEENLDD